MTADDMDMETIFQHTYRQHVSTGTQTNTLPPSNISTSVLPTIGSPLPNQYQPPPYVYLPNIPHVGLPEQPPADVRIEYSKFALLCKQAQEAAQSRREMAERVIATFRRLADMSTDAKYKMLHVDVIVGVLKEWAQLG